MPRLPGSGSSWFGLAMVLPGLVLLTIGLATIPDVASTEYYHEIEPADADEVPTGPNQAADTVFEYDDLSADGKRAVREALNASDGLYVTNETRTVGEFTYEAGNPTVQYVEYEGQYYVMETYEEDHLWELFGIGAIVLGAIGTAIGTWLWRQFD